MHIVFNLPCTGNKQKSYKIMRMNMFTAQDKVKPRRKYKRLKPGGSQAYDPSSD
jgi:hypothetical protein